MTKYISQSVLFNPILAVTEELFCPTNLCTSLLKRLFSILTGSSSAETANTGLYFAGRLVLVDNDSEALMTLCSIIISCIAQSF